MDTLLGRRRWRWLARSGRSGDRSCGSVGGSGKWKKGSVSAIVEDLRPELRVTGFPGRMDSGFRFRVQGLGFKV